MNENIRITKKKAGGRIRSPALQKYGKVIIAIELIAAVMLGKDIYTSMHPPETLERPANGEGSDDVEMNFESGELKGKAAFTVSETGLTTKEEKSYIEQAKTEINQTLFGENKSASSVWRPLSIAKTYADGMVECRYTFDPDPLIDTDGTVLSMDIEEPTMVKAEATLVCGDTSEVYIIPFRVVRPNPATLDGLTLYIQDALAKADAQGGGELVLPNEAGGHPVTLSVPLDFRGIEFAALGLLLIPLFLIAEKKQEVTNVKKRNEELTRDYAAIASKLALFTGAGIRPREAFRRIAASYEKNRKRGAPASAGYEEVKKTVVEMEEGVGEYDAYLRLGDRTDHRDFRRLTLMLTQNLQKGDRFLADELNREESDAFVTRKNNALRKGEEASTKLVFPMILLLGSVILILMLPAFMGMGV